MKPAERFGASLVLLDGAMGTMLQEKGLSADCPERLNLTHPEAIREIHRSYLDAGADIIYTNTFQANRYKLPADLTVDRVVAAAIENARNAGAQTVALDIGPTGALIEPMGDMTFDAAYELFSEVVRAGVRHGADLIALETFTSLYELKAALLAAKDCSNLPVVCSMSFERSGYTVNGTDVRCMALLAERLGAAAVGFNCSVGPKLIAPSVEVLAAHTSLPILVKLNAGVPGHENYSAEEFTSYYADLIERGASLIGGCCGTTPDYIASLNRLRQGKTPKVRHVVCRGAVCSEQVYVTTDELRIVGERINPTGKKAFRKALLEGDFGYAEREAAAQTTNEAELLDVNCGIPDLDEKETLPLLVRKVQAVTDLPLMIDTSDPEALERALRAYNGIPVVNSVNGESKSLEAFVPKVARYGASVVALCLDENGISKTAEGRLAVADKIRGRLAEAGVGDERIIFDALTLTVATGDYPVEACLDTLKVLTGKGFSTVLGVSNISFGLPNRDLINTAFLSEAIAAGLKLAIVNPFAPLIVDMIGAHRYLHGAGALPAVKEWSAAESGVQAKQNADDGSLFYAIVKGLKEEAVRRTEAALGTETTGDVVDRKLIPALDEVGALYERGQIFLPQLIGSADAAKAAFEVIRSKMERRRESKGTMILATVKGDIHDIGKNIVKAVVENYGYEVIDLGKDVAPERIVREALDNDIGLVGLSALMTTTAESMKETVALLRASGYRGKTVVGGAVITAAFARKIGADYYAKDAAETVRVAREVFGK